MTLLITLMNLLIFGGNLRLFLKLRQIHRCSVR
jgi:hypothetical protein